MIGWRPKELSEIDRLKDIIEKNQSRIAELGKTVEAVLNSYSQESNAFIESMDKLNAQLEEADKRIADHDDGIRKLEEKKQILRTDISLLEQKLRESEKKISAITSETGSTSKDLIRTEDTIKQYKSKIEVTKSELGKLEKAVSELQQTSEATRTSNDKEFTERRSGFEGAQQKIKELTEKEPVAEFLLTEASSEPPEIAIVARLIQEGGAASTEDLKKSTRVPPALALRTINSLEQKGIVERAGSDQIKLAKTP
jgi:chromosome segregation ATPase